MEERLEDHSRTHWFDKLALEMEIDKLSNKENMIIQMRYYLDFNQEAVAKRTGNQSGAGFPFRKENYTEAKNKTSRRRVESSFSFCYYQTRMGRIVFISN